MEKNVFFHFSGYSLYCRQYIPPPRARGLFSMEFVTERKKVEQQKISKTNRVTAVHANIICSAIGYHITETEQVIVLQYTVRMSENT